jgi:hypothetical protein
MGPASAAAIVSADTPSGVGSGTRPALRRVARGGSGTVITQGFISELEYNPELRGAKWYGEPGRIGVAGKMMRDPHVRASVNYVADALCAAKWRFEAASKSPLDREVATYCQRGIVKGIPFRRLVKRIVRGYMPYGFSLHEVLDDERPVSRERFPLHPGGGVGVLPIAFEERPAWTVYQWVQKPDRTTELAAVRQRLSVSDAEPYGLREIPSDRLLRITWDQEGADFSGLAPLRSGARPEKSAPSWSQVMRSRRSDGISRSP